MSDNSKIIFGFVGLVVLLLVLPTLCATVGIIDLPFLKLRKQVELNQSVITKTYETEYCLGNYEWFKQQLQDIQSTEKKIVTAENDLKSFQDAVSSDRSKWTFEDKNEESRLRSNVTGLKNLRDQMVGDYNSRSQQLNRIACKELPLFVNP